MRRLIVAGAVVLAGASTIATAAAVSPAASVDSVRAAAPADDHVGPDKVAWYDASRPAAAAPAAPMPGVGPKDLVVEGLTINTALLPISLPIPPIRQVTAFAALSFKLPAGATPASLTLKLHGFNTTVVDKHLPSGVTPIACPVTSSFKPGLQQSIAAAPKYDCSKRSTVGQLSSTGKAVTFPGISRLLVGNTLSVVILPGSLGLERLVFSPPNGRTLSLLSFDTTTPTAEPSIPPAPSPTASTPAQPGNAGRVPPIPPAPAITAPEPTASSPVIAPTPGLTAVALSKPDDAKDRARALGMLLLLVAAVAWLVVTDRSGRVAGQEMGVGRFRSVRSGPPPSI
ncbi:MAG TPA: hypothetical protein VHA79_14875 [Mycobacteriales bacterium]|jgi:hypothetical protein|nr:hypothetical protein [Mycobacteriales bacterium]HVX70967.1 hypothetical protein [Mycobacteriales bacterium]